jgi:alpha-ketoglutarate-dependent taurine dioxygenase
VTTHIAAPTLPTYDLSAADIDAIRVLVDQPDTADWLREGGTSSARHLPEPLLDFLDDARHTERAGAFVVRGFPVDDKDIGATPPHWRDAATSGSTRVHEHYLLSLASVLGDVFAFRALQAGRLVQDLLPIAGQDDEKNGNSSRSTLDLHTEDAFHPNRCDYLGLLCLRNHDRVPTSFAEFDPATVDAEALRVLFEPRFVITPDSTHPRLANPEPAPLLWGDPSRPYLRFDDYFTEPLTGDRAAARAFAALGDSLGAAERAVTLAPGDTVFIDNHLAVHGRRPFTARYDGTDRWIKRVSVTRDLRRSRALRASADSRVID